ncbi:MAG: SHOCT domain-containing protein, partial [Smithellaceae bacterium]|nr:SHOCT domain-containing protein [Smithellaceae bacterium]
MKKALIVASFLLLPLLGTACRLGGPGGGWEYGHMMDYGFGYGGMFMWVIFLIVVVVAIYFIARALKEK